MIKPRRVVIIGAGHVGSHVGVSLAAQGICDEIVFIDTDSKKAVAQTEDLFDATAYFPHHVEVWAGDYSALDDAEICVISAGSLPDFAAGEDRMDSLGLTMREIKPISKAIKERNYKGIIISISNPADVIARYIQSATGIPAERVVSTSTTLDSARLKKILARELRVDQKSITAYVMGEHGESQMVAWSQVLIGGRSLLSLMKERPEEYGRMNLKKMAGDARYGGWLVLEGKGSTEFGIGASAAELIKAILANERKILPISTMLNGEYGQNDVYASVPAALGREGVCEIIELELTEDELAEFAASCDAMRKSYALALEI